MSEYTRYWDSYKLAAEATGKGYQPRDPRIEGNTVRVATGGKVSSRTKLELYDLPKKKPEQGYQPKGKLPGGTKDKGTNYKGYNKGNPSPSSYGKRP